MATSDKLRAVVMRDNDQWSAQCLEYDIAAQGGSVQELIERLYLTIMADFNGGIEAGGKPFSGVEPAPQHYFDLYERSEAKVAMEDLFANRPSGMPDVDMKVCA